MSRDGPGSPRSQAAAAGVDLRPVDLAGVVLPDARTGRRWDLGAGPPLAVLVAIRHRY